jgi:hypothetical protein
MQMALRAKGSQAEVLFLSCRAGWQSPDAQHKKKQAGQFPETS